jgi:hypothetical protein
MKADESADYAAKRGAHLSTGLCFFRASKFQKHIKKLVFWLGLDLTILSNTASYYFKDWVTLFTGSTLMRTSN